MKLTCPACGAVASLDTLVAHRGAREAVQIALALPDSLGELLVRYVALFRPPRRQLSLDRLARLLGELHPLIASASIQRNGRAWPAPLEYWRAALEDIIAKRDKLTLPLKSHGYLLEILAGLAHRAETRAETRREDACGGRTPIGLPPPPPPSPSALPPPAEKQPMPDRVRAALKKGTS